MGPSIVLTAGFGALLLLVAGRLLRSDLLRGIRWSLALVVVTSLLDWGVAVIGLGGRWEEITSLAVLVALGLVAARVLVAAVLDWLLVQRVGIVMPRLASEVVTLVLYIAVTAAILHYVAAMNFDGLLLPSAVITVLVGLALQETLGTLLSGLALAWERRLEAGVWVELDGIEGEVETLGWRSLVLRTTLHERIVVPNSQAARTRIKVFGTGEAPVAFRVRLQAGYGTPPQRVKRVLAEICRDLPFAAADHAATILTQNFDPDGVLYECRVWTHEPGRHSDIVDALLTRAHAAFKREGINIPLPQRVLITAGASAAPAAVVLCRQALADCQVFGGLPPDAMEILAGASRWLEFAPGEVLVREGDESRALFVVAAGEAVVLHDGAEVARVGAGDVFGEMAFLSGEPRSATVRAAGATTVVEVDSRALRALLTERGELAGELANRMATRRAALEAAHEAAAGRQEHHGLVSYLLERLQRLVSS